MTDIARLFQAFLAPAIFVSATALLILSVNVRLMGMVSRLRQYVHAKQDAVQKHHLQDAEAYTTQIKSIEQRAKMIQQCFLLVLIGSCRDDRILSAARRWTLLEGSGNGRRRRFCSGNDLPAGRNPLLHARS
jgi:Protein of unknown function (DUF2721)